MCVIVYMYLQDEELDDVFVIAYLQDEDLDVCYCVFVE